MPLQASAYKPTCPPTPGSHYHLDGDLLALGECLRASGYRFVTVSPATHRRVNARTENAWARNVTDVLGWSRPFHAGVVAPDLLALMREAKILIPHGDGWRSAVRASTLGGEVYFHSAYPTTDPDAVFFGPDTYRFIRALQASLGSITGTVRRAVDVGCGAGPGALTVARRFPAAEVIAGDINECALRLARVNFRLAGAQNVCARNSSLLHDLDGGFDLIVSNPPFMHDRDARAYRHGGGLLGAGLSIDIVEAAIGRLAPGGTLLLYTGAAVVEGEDVFLRDARPRLEQAGFTWKYAEIDPDIFGGQLDNPAYATVDRIAAVLLTAVRPSYA